MEVRRVAAKEEVEQNQERIALQRGPLVYCVEGVDNDEKAWNLIVPENTQFTPLFQNDLLGGVTTIQFEAPVVNVSDDGMSLKTENKTITAIPYYAWANRGRSQMQVWLPVRIKDVKINY
jgi:hypothetical protein